MFRTSIVSVVLSVSTLAAAEHTKDTCPEGKRSCRAFFRHIESGGIGYEDGYTTFEGFFAPDPNQWAVTPFLDLRGHIFDNGKWAANAGAGLRTLWGNRAYGINSYYDYRNTGRFHSNQIGAGLETLGERLDFRINGYLPVGAKQSTPYDPVFGTFSGHSLIISQKLQTAMKGANAEFGFHLKKLAAVELYAAAGPYYFIGENAPATWGGKARLAATYKDLVTFELSDSYDRTFRNKFQGQVSLGFSFGPKSKVKAKANSCAFAGTLNDRMLQPVERQEIIVIDNQKENVIAINPATGQPYYFVFVNNTSSSDGTYESPYHSFAQAQSNSSANDIIYVFPGDGTTRGMNAGIALKASQKLWGSGINHPINTTQGIISIPALSSATPTITNTNVDTEGNAITLATNNAISGFNITAALNDAIYGTNAQNLDISSCTFRNTPTFPIEATFSGAATISVTDNQFLNNVNGVSLTLNGTSTLFFTNNTVSGQTSVSNVPLEIAANNNTFTAQIQNNLFRNNTTGSIRMSLTSVVDATISVLDNTITGNGTGSQASLGSSLVMIPTGTTSHCSLILRDNTFSSNTSNALYLHTSGAFTRLEVTATTNTISNHGGSALVLATPVTTLTLLATDNTMTTCNDNGIAVIASGTTTTGTITINNNTITGISNTSNGMAINQDFSTLNLTLLNNTIDNCEGTGIISYAPTGIGNLTMTISGNAISNCDNLSANAASGIDIEQFTTLAGTVTNNTLSNNATTTMVIGSTLTAPTACLTFSGNVNDDAYSLTNPGDGLFNLSPCNVNTANTGTINTSGTINTVQSCPGAVACPP